MTEREADWWGEGVEGVGGVGREAILENKRLFFKSKG